MATISNLYVDQGSTFSCIVTLTNQDGSLIDLTGYTVKSQFRKSYQSSQGYTFTSTVYDAVNGQVRLELDPETTVDIRAGRYLYDVEITSGSQKFRVLEGIVVITPEITKI